MAMEAKIEWIRDLQFVGRANRGPAVVLDTPEGGSGASPMELMLLGTAGCTAIDVMTILKKKRMKVSGFQIRISGNRTEAFPKRFEKIHITYRVYGTDINPKGVEQAIALSEEKYCGAMASLNAEITHSYEIMPPE